MSGNITKPPAGHGKSFTKSIDNDHPVFQISELCNALVFANEIDILIDLIGDDENLRMPEENSCQCFQFFFAIYRTARITGRENRNTFELGVMAASSCAALILNPVRALLFTSTTLPRAIFTNSL